MTTSRFEFGIAYDDQHKDIYVFGGYDEYQHLKHCEKFSIPNNKWTEIAPMSCERSNTSACILNDQFILIIGGYENGSLN